MDQEIERYRKALSSSRLDLEEIQMTLKQDGSAEAVTIIDTHIQMLQDPFMTTFIEDKIRKMLLNTEAVFQTAIADYEKQFNQISDAFFQQRLIDVQDLSQRVLRHLYSQHHLDIKSLDEETILVAKEFCPSHVAEAPLRWVKGFIAEIGSSTAHSGLIARAKGVPFLTQIDEEFLKQYENQYAILDGEKGILILNPTQKTLEKYRNERTRIQDEEMDYSGFQNRFDHNSSVAIQVFANCDSIADLPLLKKFQADGIGLFRSEFLFFDGDKQSFQEDKQLQVYSKIFQEYQDDMLVFRVFDFGGDKKFYIDSVFDLNPALGLRSIRLLLKYKELFKTQLKALFRAAKGRSFRLLLPFIADVEEMLESKKIISQAIAELPKKDHPQLKLGAMIEMPAAVVLCHQIAQYVDFFSVGPNDLIQYTLVSDRQNASMEDALKSSHPSILLMLKRIIEVGKEKKIPVCLCGEMASNPLFTPLLIGLGFTMVSCSMRYIPKIKEMIQKIDFESAQLLAERVVQLQTAQEIYRLLVEYSKQLKKV